jgi:hypothetical protein
MDEAIGKRPEEASGPIEARSDHRAEALEGPHL